MMEISVLMSALCYVCHVEVHHTHSFRMEITETAQCDLLCPVSSILSNQITMFTGVVIPCGFPPGTIWIRCCGE